MKKLMMKNKKKDSFIPENYKNNNKEIEISSIKMRSIECK